MVRYPAVPRVAGARMPHPRWGLAASPRPEPPRPSLPPPPTPPPTRPPSRPPTPTPAPQPPPKGCMEPQPASSLGGLAGAPFAPQCPTHMLPTTIGNKVWCCPDPSPPGGLQQPPAPPPAPIPPKGCIEALQQPVSPGGVTGPSPVPPCPTHFVPRPSGSKLWCCPDPSYAHPGGLQQEKPFWETCRYHSGSRIYLTLDGTACWAPPLNRDWVLVAAGRDTCPPGYTPYETIMRWEPDPAPVKTCVTVKIDDPCPAGMPDAHLVGPGIYDVKECCGPTGVQPQEVQYFTVCVRTPTH